LPEAVSGKKISVIEIGPFDELGLANEINRFLDTEIKGLRRIDSYVLVHSPEVKGLENLLKSKPFVDPVIYRGVLDESLASELNLPFDHVLQSMLNPGTSDAAGDTALRQALLALGAEFKEGDMGFYSPQHLLIGDLTPRQLEEVSAFLANPDLNARKIISHADYENGVSVEAPMVILKPEINVREYDLLKFSDEELVSLSSTRKLAASLEEMRQFRNLYKDKEFIDRRRSLGLSERATDVELEVWFGLRSEHCFHKELNSIITLSDTVRDPIFTRAYEKGYISKDRMGRYVLDVGIFKRFIEEPARLIYSKLEKRGNNWIVDMFRDNAGTVLYNPAFMYCIKFETHNSPSNIEPKEGAKTGIDGVNRDIYGNQLGTFEALSNFFYYCTGSPEYKGWLPKGVKHPHTLLKGITQGVKEGGNESQIPTLGGGASFDPRFIAKILVYCGTVGWSPTRAPDGRSYIGKHPEVRDLLFVAGQPVGRDGIHGATESSLSAGSHISLGHVQADFSFVQAKMKEYLLECARDGLFTSIGDCGAMGISVVLELARDTGGMIADLGKHPRKYLGIQPWEAAVSETQDRMVPVANPKDKDELMRRAGLHDVQITEIGRLTDSGYAQINWGDKTVALLDLERLSNKEPRKKMHAVWNGPGWHDTPLLKQYSIEDMLCMVMAQPDVASKEWFFRQKDSSVKGATIQGPLIGLKQEVEADATIQKPLETEGHDFGALAYSYGIAPKVSDIDAYYAAQRSYVDMVGKIIAVGGALPDMENAKWDAWAVCGNYCQPNSDSNETLTKESGRHNLASVLREAIAIRETEEAFNIPVISGKDSMKCSCTYEVDHSFNLGDVPPDLKRHINVADKDGKRYIEIHDPPSYLASCAVKIDDYRKCVSQAFKEEGDIIYVLGTTKEHLGASQLFSAMGYMEQGAPLLGGKAPQADLDEFITISKAVHEVIDHELVASCSYIHNGGLGAAIAKAAMAGEKGAWLEISNDMQLFSETPGRFMMTVADNDDSKGFERILNERYVPYTRVGMVSGRNSLEIRNKERFEDINLAKVKESYQKPLRL
jgi:phosphoribosylformylglycinamidine synthase subunit PurSL